MLRCLFHAHLVYVMSSRSGRSPLHTADARPNARAASTRTLQQRNDSAEEGSRRTTAAAESPGQSRRRRGTKFDSEPPGCA
jgi:hypothetical protein